MTKTTLTLLALIALTCISVAHADSVDLTWTAPGDDGLVGTAARYDLRVSPAPINEYNWNEATPVTGLPAPGPSGTPESFTVEGLTSGQTYYFALRTADEVLNWSTLSNVIVRTIAPENLAPADVVDLEGVTSTPSSVTLRWSAPGDDGVDGTAAQYDLRYAEYAISESNWNAATAVSGLSAPRSSGSTETFTVTGLTPGTQYYFALRTADEVPNWSGLSNLAAFATTADAPDLPPAEIADLTATAVTASSVSLSWTAPGADGNLGVASQYDLRYATFAITESNWGSATSLTGLASPQPAGSRETYEISGLAAGTAYYFAIRTADEASQWSGLSNVVPVETATEADYPVEIADLAAIAHTLTSVSLAWTAPGTEDGSGAASQYDLRFANYQITEANWSTANRVNSVGTPKPAGTSEAFTIYALTPNIKYYIAVKAADPSGTWSAMSNVVTRTTGAESVAPADVVDLKGINATETSVTLFWTAPGDNGASGTASEYDLRFAFEPITAANWNAAERLEGLAAPREAGSAETYTISGLSSGTGYFFALRTADEIPNWSGISNVVKIQTLAANPPPGSILNLAGSEVTTSAVTLTWTATGADGTAGTASSYDLCCATVPISESNWGTITHLTGLPAPSAAGSSESFTVNGLAPETHYYFAVKACDELAQWSGLSNVVGVVTESENRPPTAISSLAVTDKTSRSVSLMWTAPADGMADVAVSQYDLRYATTPITEANWAAANAVANEPSPSAPGSQETYTVSGLIPATLYYFAVRSADASGLWSGLSNIVGVETDIEIIAGTEPPADIADLACVSTTRTSVSLSWTAPGTDGMSGTASEYDLRFANYPISESNWSTANRVTSVKAPQSAGTREEHTVWALTPGIKYYFAIKTADEVPAWSNMSNIVTATTGVEVPEPAEDNALHVSAIEPSRKQYKTWCRGLADVYVVDAEGLPVAGALVAVDVSGPTSEILSALTNEAGVASFRTRVTSDCESQWCYSVTDVSHPSLPYDALSDVVQSSCLSITVLAAYGDFDWDDEILPEDFTLEQNYPNPFNPSTEISFSLPVPSNVRLVVINSLGQEVVTLVEGQQGAGWHSVTWDGRSAGGKLVASGLYFYHLQTAEFSESRKMMLLK